MTNRERKLYSTMKKISQQLRRTTRKKNNFRERLALTKQCARKLALEDILSRMSPLASTFIKCQLREAGRFGKQHRFTVDDKIMGLALAKQSPRAYRFLTRVFALPSISTLNNFLKNINFEPGLNENIFLLLQNTIEKWNSQEKIIVLMWDEISLMPHFDFQESKGSISGFKDLGNGKRSREIVDHAVVFMIGGFKKRFKLPLSFHFTSNGGVKMLELKTLVANVLNRLLEIGFKPISTICDQAPTNVTTHKRYKDKLFEEK
ncbi:uncharacterized protein LOC123311606 isoform X2 [Coccinella septempunctata]|nr:uncharacterized protein LOC123311606 isoform X2 [Coccinella septempunctata]XP_044751594.1 uncharacterized protein LOC123311606 isoform X2 [Coccinella septempunctata]